MAVGQFPFTVWILDYRVGSGIFQYVIHNEIIITRCKLTLKLVLQCLGLAGRDYVKSVQEFSKNVFLAWKYLFQVMINSFRANVWFLYLLETARKPLVYMTFSEGEWNIGLKWVKSATWINVVIIVLFRSR